MSRLLTPGIAQQQRNIGHQGGGGSLPPALKALTVGNNDEREPCPASDRITIVYCQLSTLSAAFNDDAAIYSDSDGNVLAEEGWYTDNNGNTYYYWSPSGWQQSVDCN